MLRKYLELPPDSNTPIPPRQFALYINFWHVVYLGMLGVMLGTTLWNARAALGWREAALTALILAQAALYLKSLVFYEGRWPLSRQGFAVYFVGSLILWFIEWRLSPNFFWLVMAYMGQMFGMLPPLAAIPGTTAIYFLFMAEEFHWDFTGLTLGDVFGMGMSWVSFIVVYFFIYYLVRTSQQRGQLVRELRAAHTELELAHQRDTELAALRERERLARDLHDSLGHALVALTVQLEAIQRLYKVDPERASAQIDELKSLTRSSMEALRRSLAGLRAPGLGEESLSHALQALSVETGQRTGMEITCHVTDEADRLSPAVAEALWRVAQEALTNVEKHAQARCVQLQVEIQPQAARLVVSDDGRGLSPTVETPPGHYGLRGMRERVEGLGGTLTINSNGTGTAVEARLPIL